MDRRDCQTYHVSKTRIEVLTNKLKNRGRKVALSEGSTTATQNNVTYGDIKHRCIDTVNNLLRALFDLEQEKCIIDLGDAWATTLANGESAQFKVIADDEGESFTVTAEDVNSSISN